MNQRRLSAGFAAGLMLIAVGCGGSDDSSSGGVKFEVPKISMLDKLGTAEGALNIIAWAGYAEDGSTDPAYDWVTPFEKASGCAVTVTNGATSDEMVKLLEGGGFDGVSASGDASLRMIASGLVAPVNTDLVPAYKDIFPFLKDQTYNSVNGQMYGIPHGWGANVLQYNTEVVSPAPDSWGVVFDPASPYKGKITAYDSPIYIADAALYLKATKPDLKITNPYALDEAQFAAAVDLLKAQKPLIGEYWSDYLKYEEASTAGSLVLGTSWQIITNTLTGADPAVPVASVLPKEGSTGWFDTWMVAAKAEHPNCMYMWMNWISGAEAQSQVTTYFGQAPANAKACELNADMKAHCEAYHAGDTAYAAQISGWTTPTKTCLDGRGDKCVPYSEWTKAWDEIKG
jgi:putative spermidine/putrescine transport system substrate-binding protein